MSANTIVYSDIAIDREVGKDTFRYFSSGERDIDKWAREKAAKFSDQGRSRVFVARLKGNANTIGFYSLSLSSTNSDKIIESRDKNIWIGSVGIVYIQYLAVHRNFQGNKIGKLLLIDALKRAYFVSQQVAFYGVGLRSLNQKTTDYYGKFGFKVAPKENDNPLMLIPIWSLQDLFGAEKGQHTT